MAASRSMRLIQTALRCYPERWRSRHGDEAAELAQLLMRDGMPARSIAWSYFRGAASTRLILAPRRSLGAALGALLAAACLVSVSLALLSSSVPASAGNFRPAGLPHCSGPAGRGSVPGSHYYVAGGTARSSAASTIRASAAKPADTTPGGRHGQHC